MALRLSLRELRIIQNGPGHSHKYQKRQKTATGFTCSGFLWLLIICFQSDASTYPSSIRLPSQTTKILKIDSNNINIDIKVVDGVYNVFKLSSILSRGSIEYIVLQAQSEPATFHIKIKPSYIVGYKPLWSITELTEDEVEQNIDHYRNLSLISQLWSEGSKESKKKAKSLAEQLLASLPVNSELYLQSALLKAYMLRRSVQFEEAFNFLEMLKKKHKNIQSNIYQKILWIQADSKLMLNERQTAYELYKQLVEMTEQNPENQGQALFQTQMLGDYGLSQLLYGWFKSDDELIEQGRESIEKAMRQADEVGAYLLMSSFLNHMWTYWAINKNMAMGEKSLLLALDYAKKSRVNSTVSSILSHLAKRYQMRGEITKSLNAYRQAISILEGTGRLHSKATVFIGMAENYRQLGNLRQSKRYYKRALETYEKLKAEHGMAKARLALGKIARDEGNFEQAINYHQAGLAHFEQTSEEDTAKLLVELGRDHFLKGEYVKARDYVERAFTVPDKIRLTVDVVDALLIKAKIAWHEGARDAFFETVEQVRATHQGELLPRHQLEIAGLMSAAYIEQDDVERLQHYLTEVMKQLSSIRETLDTARLGPVWSHNVDGVLNQFVVALITLADKTGSRQLYEQVFELLEQVSAVSLRERRFLSHGTVKEPQSEQLNLLWQQQLAAERALIKAKGQLQLTQARATLDDAREAFLRYQPTVQTSSLEGKLSYLTLPQVQARLADDELFLRYYLRDDIGFAFVVTRQNWQVMPLPKKSVLSGQVSRLLKGIKSQQVLFQSADETLKNILPKQLLDGSDIRKLIVVQDNILNVLPLSAINVSNHSKRYIPLVNRVDVTRIYSASEYFGQITSKPVVRDLDIAVFADPVFDKDSYLSGEYLTKVNEDNAFRDWSGNLTRLKWTALEAKAIADTYADGRVKVVTGAQATNEMLMSEQMRHARILHIASHGYFNAALPEVVGIATSVIDQKNQPAPGFLTLTEMLSKPFSSRLVVISGCETVLGEQLNGEGLNGLTRGVLSQGAGSVLSTLWSIPDKPTAEFMKMFYAQLKNHDGNSVLALNQTKRDFAKRGRYRAPLYWAGFVLTSSHRIFESTLKD